MRASGEYSDLDNDRKDHRGRIVCSYTQTGPGANVFYHTIKGAHVSGHGSQQELKLMLPLTKPKRFIPIHGEFRMQVQHGRL